MSTAAQKVARRKPQPGRAIGGIREWVSQFLSLKQEITTLSARQNDLKKRCMSEVEKTGYTDEKGNQYLEFPEPVESGGVSCTGIKRERRVSTVLDEESAEAFLKRKRLLEKCQTTITVLDEDKILQLLYEGKISQADLDTHVFKQKVNWAFIPLTG